MINTCMICIFIINVYSQHGIAENSPMLFNVTVKHDWFCYVEHNMFVVLDSTKPGLLSVLHTLFYSIYKDYYFCNIKIMKCMIKLILNLTHHVVY